MLRSAVYRRFRRSRKSRDTGPRAHPRSDSALEHAVFSMQDFYFTFVVFLVVNLAGGLVRILRGPTRGDRMMAAQLFGTTGVAILLVLAVATANPSLRDVALVFVVLTIVNTVVFVKRGWWHALDPRSDTQ
jgi:multicomponent Na+:H+ antiporter subunit F